MEVMEALSKCDETFGGPMGYMMAFQCPIARTEDESLARIAALKEDDGGILGAEIFSTTVWNIDWEKRGHCLLNY